MTRRTLLAIGAVFYVLAIVLAWHPVSNILAISSCVDAGGSFDHAAAVCDMRSSHPYQPPATIEFVLLGAAGTAAVIAVVFLLWALSLYGRNAP